MAGRARLRLHPGLPAGLRGRGAGGDRPAAAPQPGRAVLVGAAAAQAGRAEHGDDAGDHRRPGCGRSRAARTTARPDKEPAVRLRVLDDAGRVGVPFTTGILIGIGETLAERADAIFAIRRVAPRVRPHPGGDRAELPRQAGHGDARHARRRAARPGRHGGGGPAAARPEGPDPGPAEPDRRASTTCCCGPASTTGAGSRRSPRTTSTRSGPGRRSTSWPGSTEQAGFTLRERLTIYPEYVRRRRPVARPAAGRRTCARWPTRRPGWPSRRPGRSGRPWQEPDEVVRRRPDRPARHHRHRRPHRRPARRLRQRLRRLGGGRRARSSRRVRRTGAGCRPTTCGRGCGWRPTTRRRCSSPRHDDAALALFGADGPALDELCRLADDVRRDTVGDDVTYVVNRNINFTNVCYVGCRFCAFAQRERDADAYRLSVEQVADRAEEAWAAGATEVCMQGGIDPKLPVTGVRRPGPGDQGAGAGHARARVLPDGDRHRRGQGRRVRCGTG